MIGFNSDIPTVFVGPANGQGTTGNVGIGTSNPLAKFQVGDDYRSAGLGFADGIPGMDGTTYMGFNVARSGTNAWVSQTDFSNNGGVLMLGDIHGGFRIVQLPSFYSAGTTDRTWTSQEIFDNTVFEIGVDGRVTIGDASIDANSPFNVPETKLMVDGRIICRDLVVSEVDWQDEVFDSTYTLMPLDSVAAYIKRYSHLPGYAPEEEIEQNGMSVAETDAQQQKTIEELMLYVIELNDRVKVLEAENEKLKEEQPK